VPVELATTQDNLVSALRLLEQRRANV
jgi:hypothetical protein